ncbi:SAM-dependent methyltransferase [Streptomyces sp. NPDC094034]|uniref:SAM-dependent methyltransferase n=1 Tax=Streptomyces sp. NPDC094034 TaxID=3155309 RepID=UPI003321BDFD
MNSGEKPDSHAIDVHTPSVARMYDWLLGGIEHFASDRAACQRLLEIAPSTKALALNNRSFLRRVVRVLAEEYGVRQFLDHGSGLPTQDNVHEIAQRVDRRSRVVYIDSDPIVLARGRIVLEENAETAVLNEDMRETDRIFERPEVRRLIRDDEPVAALFVSVLHCLPDEDAGALVRRVAERLPDGSFMVICQLVSDHASVREGVTELMRDATGGNWGRVRERDEVRQYFDGLLIEDPGLIDVTDWRPDSEVVPRQRADDWVEWGGLARVIRT